MSWGAVIIAAGAVTAAGVSAYSNSQSADAVSKANSTSSDAAIQAAEMQAAAIEKAAGIQAAATRHAADLQYKTWQEQLAREKPWYDSGELGLKQLTYGLGLSNQAVDPNAGSKGYLTAKFDYNDMYADPGYGFRLSEGLKALQRNNSATGNLASGSALKAATRYGQEMGSQEYSNAYNRFNIDQANSYNRLAAMSGTGQVAAQQMGNTSQNYANAIAALTTAGAANQGDAAMAIGGVYSGLYNTLGQNSANAILAKAANSASTYQGIGNIATSAANALAQYYGGGGASYGTSSNAMSQPASTNYTWGTGYTGNYSLY